LNISAEEAVLRTDRMEEALTIVLRNGSVTRGDQIKFYFPDVFEQQMPLSDASRANGNSNSPTCIPLCRIWDAIREQQEAIRNEEEKLTVRAAFQAISGDISRLSGPQWQISNEQIGAMRRQLYRLEAEPHRRWAAGFSCLGFVWIGAPMAIRLRRGEPLSAFFLCFAPILVVYYPLLIFGINGAKNGAVPPISLWAGNLVLFVWGVWLLRKVLRY
jgi:lipopolysaccharide export system permease protein